MKLSTEERGFLNSLALYLATRRTALRSALKLRVPLTTEDADDLRIHYSNYFVNLMSASDLVKENDLLQGKVFEEVLKSRFGATGTPEETNYSYVRELRNSIVHRGLDLVQAANIVGDFPLLVSPSPVKNFKGTRDYPAFGHYVLEVVQRCEEVVGPSIESHLNALGILDKEPDIEAYAEMDRQAFRSSSDMPEWVKQAALNSLCAAEYALVHSVRMEQLRELLKPLSLDALLVPNTSVAIS